MSQHFSAEQRTFDSFFLQRTLRLIVDNLIYSTHANNLFAFVLSLKIQEMVIYFKFTYGITHVLVCHWWSVVVKEKFNEFQSVFQGSAAKPHSAFKNINNLGWNSGMLLNFLFRIFWAGRLVEFDLLHTLTFPLIFHLVNHGTIWWLNWKHESVLFINICIYCSLNIGFFLFLLFQYMYDEVLSFTFSFSK